MRGVENMVAWITSRTLHPGKARAFREPWVLKERPSGLLRIYFLRGVEDRNEMIGISVWESRAAITGYRRSAAERARQAAMKPFVKRINWSRLYEAEEIPL